MAYDNLPGLHISIDAGVATVTVEHPPLNLMDGVLLPSLRGFLYQVHDDAAVRVIVFQSADPELFIAHGDMAYLTDPKALPDATDAAIAAAPGWAVPEELNILQALSEDVRNLPQVTIGKLEGFARGAGNEFFMSLDMRFAAIGKSGQAQPEVQMGILPGGGGTVNMTRLIGRARALELILGAELVDAELAERYGLVNRALPADEIGAHVEALAHRIARLRPEVIAAVKTTVNAMAPAVALDAYAVENTSLYAAFGDEVFELADKLLAAGIQTREGELDFERISNSI